MPSRLDGISLSEIGLNPDWALPVIREGEIAVVKPQSSSNPVAEAVLQEVHSLPQLTDTQKQFLEAFKAMNWRCWRDNENNKFYNHVINQADSLIASLRSSSEKTLGMTEGSTYSQAINLVQHYIPQDLENQWKILEPKFPPLATCGDHRAWQEQRRSSERTILNELWGEQAQEGLAALILKNHYKNQILKNKQVMCRDITIASTAQKQLAQISSSFTPRLFTLKHSNRPIQPAIATPYLQI